MEYEGYGFLKSKKSRAGKISTQCHCFVSHLIHNKKIDPKSMILIGKSIGTGFASYVASKIQVAGLVLISGFASIKKVAADYVGRWSTIFVKDV